jgi:biotin-dependent carboxylase-like uncharacterized protein
MGWFEVVQGGWLATVQDPGRFGWGHVGLAEAGWSDAWAAGWANRLLGNPADAAVIEVTGGGLAIHMGTDGILSLTGADLGASVDGQPWTPGCARYLARGMRVTFSGGDRGWRAYVGVPGGVAVPAVWGSRATDLTAGIGGMHGRALKPGDRIRWTGTASNETVAPVPTWQPWHRLRCLPGAGLWELPEDVGLLLTHTTWRVSPTSNRTGVRLQGPPLPAGPGDGWSRGMSLGSIQIPPGGEPIILMQDRGTIGGYPVAAHVIQADLPRVAQLRPGDWLSFRWIDEAGARARLGVWRRLMDRPLRTAGRAPRWRTTALPAPWPGVLVWACHDGAMVHAGDAVGAVEVSGEREWIRAPHAGRVLHHARDGRVVAAGQWVGELTALEDGLEGDDDRGHQL